MTVTREEFEDVKQLMVTIARVAESNTRAIDQLTSNQQLLQQDIQLILHRMDEMQSQVRGLQTENRNILGLLQQHLGDGHGGAT
ncbi:MAG: hypothetical protein IGS48_02475 [Oscillatoriales cyanobacterium C42_A2020_001]|nr:hypothetical protein [Leptolyngbyaceae cyanobacterium C42_A2020_001]